MRGMMGPFVVWVGVLQLPPVGQHAVSLESAGALLSLAMALAGLTTMVYRLGVWRTEMHNTKHNVGAEIARYREETARDFEQLHARFTSFDQHVSQAGEKRLESERWQARTDTTVASHERRIGRLEDGVLEQERAA
jgi:alpha-L-fucosidase